MFVPVLLGMGQGPAAPDKIPVPAKKFAATFVDQMDMVTECNDVSIDGGTFLEGKRGGGNLTISFDLIDNVTMAMNANRLTGSVKFRDGNSVELVLKKDQNAYGQTKYGTFQIKLADLKKIIFSRAPQK